MNFVASLIVALFLVSASHAQCWKITSRGHSNVWAVNSSCTNNSCATGSCAQPATKTEPTQVPEVKATPSIESVTFSSCSSGSCGSTTTYSQGLFRRRR